MLVDLLPHLRCPNPHPDSWLVASARRTADRRILEGTLGCPVCGAEFPIRGGAVWFGDQDPPVPAVAPVVDVAEEAMRLAALLALDEGGGLHLLVGAWGALAGALAAVRPVQLMLVSPPPDLAGWSTLRGVGDTLPLAAASVRGVAIDRASLPLAEAAVRALGPSGRLVAPAATPVPALMTILARDDRHWVGSRVREPAGPTLVTPLRAAPRRDRQ